MSSLSLSARNQSIRQQKRDHRSGHCHTHQKIIIQSSAGPSFLTTPFKSEPPSSHHHKNSNEVHPFCFWNQLRLHFKEHKKGLFARQCRLGHWRWRKCSRSLLLSKVFTWQHASCLMPHRHKKNMQTQFSSIYIEPHPKTVTSRDFIL